MKKIFTFLSFVMLFALTANAAEDNYRRTWDFRTWSASTLELMATDTKHWQEQSTGFQNTADFASLTAVVTYNGDDMEIPELKGITVGGLKNAKHVQIYDGKTTNSSFPDAGCIWLNGKNAYDYIEFVVPAGENVKFGYCSHSNSEERGFKTSSPGFADADGNTTFKSIADATIIEVELINSNAEESILKLNTATGGAHIYYIIIGEGDVQEETTVGYLYAGGTMEEKAPYKAVADMDLVTFKGIDIDDAVPSAEELMAFSAVIIDGSVPASAKVVATLCDNIFWQPVVNFSKDLAVALDFGEEVSVDNELAWFMNPKHSWIGSFDGFANDEGTLTTATAGNIFPNALRLTGHAKADKVIVAGTDEYATPDTVIAYTYNTGHNTYTYYGVPEDFAEGTEVILKNIINDAIMSKADITATPTPVFNADYKQSLTLVTLSCLNKNAKIFYTVDGSEPTIESKFYMGETLEFTEPTTIKAFAIADGYHTSDINSFEVKIFNQAKKPSISVDGDADLGDRHITITSEDEGVDIWYNFTGSTDTLLSSKYNGPVTIKYKAEITTFAISDSLALVRSDILTDSIFANKKNVRRDVVAHFSANGVGYDDINNFTYNGEQQTAWANTSKYYFPWGKTARASVIAGDPILDGEGNPMYDDDGNPMFEQVEQPFVTAINAKDPDWALTSQGQVMIFQTNTLDKYIGDFTGYNPERAEDIIEKWATNADIQFAGVASGDKFTAAIRSTVKYAGPFNVIAVVANVSGDKTTGVGNPKQVAVQVSKDGTTWETVGDTLTTAAVYRNYKTFEVAYEGGEEVFVRLASINGSSQAVHDIYVLNQGEKSQAEMDYYRTGIKDVNVSDDTLRPAKAVKMIKDGKIVIVTAKGTYSLTGAQIK